MTERLVALGLVVEWSAGLEEALREAFCALTGSKFAPVVAGGQAASWLIGQCRALADAHKELPEPARKAIREALESCETANKRRNDLVHGILVDHRGYARDEIQTHRSRRHTYLPATESWTFAQINEAAIELAHAGFRLEEAIYNALGPEMARIYHVLPLEHARMQHGTE